jgi:DNA repair protein RecO (recombination protein O)
MEALLDHLGDAEDSASPRARLAATGLSLLSAFGWGIDFDRCVSCGKQASVGQAASVDAARGGLVCRNCGGARRRLSGDERRALSDAALGGGKLDDELAALALDLVEQALKAHGGIE